MPNSHPTESQPSPGEPGSPSGAPPADLRPAALPVDRLVVGAGGARAGQRWAPEETPIAIVCDGSTYAVMMATPADLEDFAIGFCLTEGVISDPAEVRGLDVEAGELGVELRLWLEARSRAALAARRRTLAGPTGCGLCGFESLQALGRPTSRPPARIAPLEPAAIGQAMASLGAALALGPVTRATHAAGFWRVGDGLVLAREDVGRHNAVDKLAGAMARARIEPAGVLVLTSRVSVELVEKAAVAGIPVIAAISAPTALAVRTAEANDITLVAVARSDGFEVFAHPRRLALGG